MKKTIYFALLSLVLILSGCMSEQSSQPDINITVEISGLTKDQVAQINTERYGTATTENYKNVKILVTVNSTGFSDIVVSMPNISDSLPDDSNIMILESKAMGNLAGTEIINENLFYFSEFNQTVLNEILESNEVTVSWVDGSKPVEVKIGLGQNIIYN